MRNRMALVAAALVLVATLMPAAAVADEGTSPAHNYRDDFDGALDSGWEWPRPDPANWSLSANPGKLHP